MYNLRKGGLTTVKQYGRICYSLTSNKQKVDDHSYVPIDGWPLKYISFVKKVKKWSKYVFSLHYLLSTC
jgi:hypothetical protein